MSWFEIKGGRLRFRGRTTKHPVLEWLASDEGTRAVDAAASRIRFSLLGRSRAARRRISRALREAIASPAACEAIAAECDHYLAAWTQLAYAPSLPRMNIGLQRLVIVPRVMMMGRTMSAAKARVVARLAIPDLVEPFKAFFSRWILREIDLAVRRTGPSPRRPVYARESWACVAVDDDLIWIDPSWSGPDWRGHALMFEIPARGLQRRDRKELEAAIEQSKQFLKGLTRVQREDTVRVATDQMETLRFGLV